MVHRLAAFSYRGTHNPISTKTASKKKKKEKLRQMQGSQHAKRQNSFISLTSAATQSPVSNITVAVRVRPLTAEEERNGCRPVVSVSGNE